jgi:hypothetical protein
MTIKSKKQSTIALLALFGATAWPMTSLACPTNTTTTKYVSTIIGGSALCIAVKTNGVDAEIGLDANFVLDHVSGQYTYTGTTPWPTKFSSLGLAVKPTSPGACGEDEGEEGDCDDMKEADSHNSNTQTQTNVLTSTAVAAVTLPPSGLVSCSRVSSDDVLNISHEGHNSDDGHYYDLVPVPGNIIVSLFTGTNSAKPESGGLWTIKSTALDPLNETNPNYVLLKGICNPGSDLSSIPKDFVPNNLKSKISVQSATFKKVGTKSLTCSLNAYQFTQIVGDPILIAGSDGMIGLQDNHNDDGEGHSTLMPLDYNCQ